MGFYTRIIIPPGLILDNIELVKSYLSIDKIDIKSASYIELTHGNDENTGKISDVTDEGLVDIIVILNIYNSYEERLERRDPSMFTELYIQGLIDKNFSENLWTKCYIKIKELILNQNTESLKEALTTREIEANPITGIETGEILDEKYITVDTIPIEYQYLLEIDDHFN